MFKVSYASRDFMLSKLPAMGLTGPAAGVSRSIGDVPEYDERHPTIQHATNRHQRQYEANQRTQKAVQDSLTSAQRQMMQGGMPAMTPRVIAENPYDIWVDPRAHMFRSTSVTISDRELVNANEPWRIYTDAQLGSIKHRDTK